MYPGACFVCGSFAVCDHRELELVKLADSVRKHIEEAEAPKKQAQSEELLKRITKAK